MKRLPFLLLTLCLAVPAVSQSMATATGVIQDAAGNTATSGNVVFKLSPWSPAILYRVGGVTLIAPTIATCGIDATGHILNLALSGACQVWGNDNITPANTCYQVVEAPGGVIDRTIEGVQITGAGGDLSSPTFCPSVRITPEVAAVETAPSNANVIPGTDNFYNVGGPQNRYAQGYFANLNATNGCTGCGINGVLNVKSYGAKGDCVTDDSVAAQAAINAASATFGVVYVPTGCYVIGTVLTGTSSLYGIIGDGPHLSRLKVPSSSSTNSIFTTTAAPDSFKLRGLEFDGPGQSASGGQKGVVVGFSGGNVSLSAFEDLFIKDWPNYGLELDAPIACWIRNVRVLTSMKGIFYNGGTSCTTTASYMNSITKVGYDVKGAAYMTFIGNAADVDGLAYWIRNASFVIGLNANGHERGTARNVTVTNVSLTTNVATVTYTGDDLSADFQSGMTIVVNGTTSTAGLFNVRAVPTSVTSSTIVYPLTHADVVSAADTGTACLFCGDGIVVNNSTAARIDGFYGIAAQQTYSNHVTISGNSANPKIENVVSTLGTTGTPVAQTIDIYIGASVANVFRFNTNLLGGVTGLSSQIQTYSSNLWTLGGLADNTGTPATAGFLRFNKTDALNLKSNTSGDVNGLSMDANDTVVTGGAAGTRPGSVAFASLGTPNNGTMVYCSDCTIANPCAGGGTGAIAKRLNGVWVCN